MHAVARHLDCEPTELEHASMVHGFDIELDFALYSKNIEEQSKYKLRRKPIEAKTEKKPVVVPKENISKPGLLSEIKEKKAGKGNIVKLKHLSGMSVDG